VATKIEVTTNDKHRESDEVMRPILIAVNQLCPRVKYIHVEWGLENTFIFGYFKKEDADTDIEKPPIFIAINQLQSVLAVKDKSFS